MKHCVKALTGLKLNPDSPEEKAIMRIQEKMLFKGVKYERPPFGTQTMQEVLDGEEESYKSYLAKLLESKSEVIFTISDMVRGKCVFLSIEDIIATVRLIRQF